MLAAIGGGFVTFVNGILGNMDAAKGYIGPLKEFFGDVPAWGWGVVDAAIAAVIWRMAQKAETKGVEAYRTGARA